MSEDNKISMKNYPACSELTSTATFNPESATYNLRQMILNFLCKFMLSPQKTNHIKYQALFSPKLKKETTKFLVNYSHGWFFKSSWHFLGGGEFVIKSYILATFISSPGHKRELLEHKSELLGTSSVMCCVLSTIYFK